ncbi:uncharacterized protein EDB93DRAFT_1096636, partial [Suillus bovinus]|uniref:uncharacterized protein n=1 Tax=Suillus bovinus TaxID=48563 RepID=UPI001B87FA74
RPPVTLEHMYTLFHCLDLSNSFNAAVHCTISVAFWSCCRLSELIIPSQNVFDSTHHVSHSVSITHRTTPGGAKYASFYILWTKTMHGKGDFITISKIDDPMNPYDTLVHHISANSAVPPSAPLFAFETKSGWAPMTWMWFLTQCNNVWKSESLETLSSHCFWIGGVTELLLRGTPPSPLSSLIQYKIHTFPLSKLPWTLMSADTDRFI